MDRSSPLRQRVRVAVTRRLPNSVETRMAELFARYRVAGFNTYGEQHSGMHVNQTFVGLALMPAGAAP